MTPSPKIAINATLIHNDPSGLGVYTYELLLELLRATSGFDFIVYASSGHLIRSYPNKIVPASQLTSPDYRFMGNVMRILWQQTVLPFNLKREKISLVYSPVPEGIVFPLFKQIVTVHDIIPIKYPELYPKQKYHFYFTVPILLKHSHAVICDSENTKRDTIAHYGVKEAQIRVIYPGFNTKRFFPQPKGVVGSRFGLTNYFLYVGDMRPYKNLERSLEAFASLNAKDLQFVIGGKKDRRFYPKIEKKVAELSLQDKVIFLGYVPEEDLPHLYSDAVGLIHASLYEGFGLPPLEAMACGCPVIASKVASLPEVCGDAAYYVDPYHVDSIAQGMSRILTDSELRNRLTRRGIERAHLFSWKRTAEELKEVFKEVLEKK